MKDRLTGALLVLSFLILVSAGCGSKNRVMNYENPEDREITTITFFGNKYEPENVAIIEEIISDFMTENPDIRVSYESLKGSGYYEALRKRMASGKGDDVFMVNHDVLLELEGKGQVADLSGLSTLEEYTDLMRSQMDEKMCIRDRFLIYLQPKYRIRDDKLAGAEALVRWNHPKWGFQSPAEFIPLFEKNGFITKLDLSLIHIWIGYPHGPRA